MSVKTTCQNAARLLSINVPTSFVSSDNVNAKRLLEAFILAGEYRRRDKEWPQLIKTHTITQASGTSKYDLPDDFLAFINKTVFDVDGQRPMDGPLASHQWAFLKYGITSVGPFIKFRIAGATKKRFEISPTPSASGAEIVFLYRSTNWLLPREWATATGYTVGNYVSNSNGDIYKAATAATSGGTEPTHTSGTSSDGGVQWTYYDGVYARPMSDDDSSLLDEDLLKLDVVWNFRMLSGLDYASFQANANVHWENYFSQIRGAPSIHLGGYSQDDLLLSYSNVPDTGFGS